MDDGSTDRTAEVARRFASKGVEVVSTANHGLSGAVNHAFRLCQGDYIQELDSDDLLSPDKIERQLAALREGDSKRILLSSPWAHFYYRPQPCPLRSQLPMARPFARRVAAEEDERKPPHAKRDLAGEPGTGRGRRALGRTSSLRSRRRIFCPRAREHPKVRGSYPKAESSTGSVGSDRISYIG